MVIWVVGLSGSGKTSLARALKEELASDGEPSLVLDGDEFREIFQGDLGHTLQDRRKNAERISRMCLFLERQNILVICPILSAFEESRKWNRDHFDSYLEVFLDASKESLFLRDDKGLYQPALQGKIENVVGVDIPFETPESPDLVIQQDFTSTPEELASIVIRDLSIFQRLR